MSAKRRPRGGGGEDLADLGQAAAAAAAVVPSLPLPVGALDRAGLEALGLAQEQARRKESTGSLSSKYWLSFLPQPPRHPFVRSYFPLKVVLVDSKKALKTGWPLQLTVELLYENGEVVSNQSANVEVHGHDESRPIILPASGSLDLKVRVLTCSAAHDNKSFFLRFSGIPLDKSVPSHVTLMPATSTLMTVIRHRICIVEQPPTNWYKDEGGRDNCIAINGLLVDEHEQPVQGREVPLKIVLCYEGEECTEVKNQSIMKMPDPVAKVDKFGRIALKLRIEEVSKNHQKQAFVVKVTPSVAFGTENCDISADVSRPINVLSKRNKRRPKRDGAEEDSPDGPQPVRTGLHYQPPPPMFSLPAASAAAATMPLAYTKLANSALAQASSSVLPTITPTGAAAKPPTHLPQGLATTSLSGANMTRITSADGSSVLLNDSSDYKPHPSPTFADTISHLVNWSVHVNDLLTKIEWQHVGFEVLEDGQMNLHRPLYRCPGCWSYQDTIRQTGHKESCKISKLSSAYRTHVYVYLQDLLNMATGNSSLAPTTSTSSAAPGAAAANPAQLASSNSLMAAYSRNGGGNIYLTHTPSQSSPPPRHNSGFLPSASSIVNAATSLGLQSQLSISGAAVQRTASTAKQDAPAAADAAADEPAAKKPRPAPVDASAQAAQANNLSLFPGDWQNLAAMEPLQSPNGFMDRGLSALGVGDRGMSMLAGDSSVLLGAFQPDGIGLSSSELNDLPTDSLSLLRAGSLNLESLLSDSTRDEANVDAIHVTATPLGFPTFSAGSGSRGPELLGMYQYDQSTSFLVFVPLAKLDSQITPVQAREMERIYRQLRDDAASGSSSGAGARILTRQQCITLEKLKEEALLLHYATQAGSFLSADSY